MNTLNCFQAIGFYTALPLVIQWCFANNLPVLGSIFSVGLFFGYIILSIRTSEK